MLFYRFHYDGSSDSRIMDTDAVILRLHQQTDDIWKNSLTILLLLVWPFVRLHTECLAHQALLLRPVGRPFVLLFQIVSCHILFIGWALPLIPALNNKQVTFVLLCCLFGPGETWKLWKRSYVTKQRWLICNDWLFSNERKLTLCCCVARG